MSSARRIDAGKISGVFGIKGWVKVFSYTEPKDNILSYSPWIIRKNDQEQEVKVVQGSLHGKTVVAQLDGINDRDSAAKLQGAEILISYSQLPEAEHGSYYWADLIGLAVVTTSGTVLGKVDSLLETGANDVLVVHGDKERLIPFLQPQTVQSVDLKQGKIVVDWDPDF